MACKIDKHYFYCMLTNHIVLAFLWIVYCFLHSWMAGLSVKKFLQMHIGKFYRYYRLFYTILAFVLLVLVVFFQINVNTWQIYQPNIAARAAGVLLMACGVLLMIICIRKYFLSLSGLLSLVQQKPTGSSLMVTGIHKHIRHPLYLGTFAAIWGFFLLLPLASLLVAFTIITVYTLAAIRLEEKKLAAEFGESYKVYQQQVPMILPRFGRRH